MKESFGRRSTILIDANPWLPVVATAPPLVLLSSRYGNASLDAPSPCFRKPGHFLLHTDQAQIICGGIVTHIDC